MTTPKPDRRRTRHYRNIPLQDKPINWQKENRLDTRRKQDAKFQLRMLRQGFVLHTSTEVGTNIPKSGNSAFYGDGRRQSPSAE